MDRGRARPLGRLEVKTLRRRDQEDEQDDAPVAAVGVGEAPPHVEWEMSARSWRSEAPQHRCGIGPPRGEPRSSEPPERAALRGEGGTRRGGVGAAQSRLVLVNPDELLAII